MKKEIKTKLKNIAFAMFDNISLYERDDLNHSYTLVIFTNNNTLINKYTFVIQACGYPINYVDECFYSHYDITKDLDDNDKNIAGFIITFRDVGKKE